MAQSMLNSSLVAVTTEYSLTCGQITILVRKKTRTKDVEVCLRKGQKQFILDYKTWQLLSSVSLDVETEDNNCQVL